MISSKTFLSWKKKHGLFKEDTTAYQRSHVKITRRFVRQNVTTPWFIHQSAAGHGRDPLAKPQINYPNTFLFSKKWTRFSVYIYIYIYPYIICSSCATCADKGPPFFKRRRWSWSHWLNGKKKLKINITNFELMSSRKFMKNTWR